MLLRAMSAFALALTCSAVDAQLHFERVAQFGSPSERERRVSGGREVEFNKDGSKMIAAFYGSSAQIFDLVENTPVGQPIRTAGDGEVGFVNNQIAYTADWDSVRLWDTQSGEQVGDPIAHVLREDTIIHPAIGLNGKFIATRATMKSVQLWETGKRKPIGNQIEYSAEVHSIRFSEDGELLFVGAGGSLHAIDPLTAEAVAGPIKSGWRFHHDADHQRLLTTQRVAAGVQLVIRATDQKGFPETHRSDLPGKLSRIIALQDGQVFLQVTKEDYTPALFTFSVDKPEVRVEVKSDADRAFGVVVTPDKRHWICSNIRNISCQRFGETEPVWQMQVPPSGFDQKLDSFDNEHFIIRDKQENLGVYKVADASVVWSQTGVKRLGTKNDRIAICNRNGVEVWEFK